MKRPLLALAFAFAAVASSWSHGANYPPPAVLPGARPAGSAGGPSGPGAGPSVPMTPTPGGTLPGPAAAPRPPFPPATTPKDELPDPARWQLWWSYNHDAFLDLRARVQALATASPENLSVLARRELQQRLANELVKMIERGGKEPVLRHALLALARLAKVPALHVPLKRLTALYLARDTEPGLQEAALLALGVAGDAAAIEALRQVLMDDAAGRALLAQEAPIPTRMRVFSAYALALLGERDPSEVPRRRIVHALLFALGQEGIVERELRVACALALGRVPIQACETPEQAQDPARQIEERHLCGGVQTEYLLAIVSDPELDPWFRGHAAASLGRLAARAGAGLPAADDHPAVPSRDELVRALVRLAREASTMPPVFQGCLLGLGFVVDADGDATDQEARAFLQKCRERAPAMAQRFALIALASALGRPGNDGVGEEAWKDDSGQLLREFGRARGASLGWSALALAVAGHGRLVQARSQSQGLVAALRTRLLDAAKIDEAAACALALCVLRPADAETAAALRKTFTRLPTPTYRIHGALALGMLGVREARPALEKALDAPDLRVDDVIAASLGLRLLGDPDVVPALVTRLAHTDPKKPDEALALVGALALLQDPLAGAPLIPLALDESRDVELRAAIVWCLGMLADPDTPDWTASFANGIDYSFLPWTLRSPQGDGRGILDAR